MNRYFNVYGKNEFDFSSNSNVFNSVYNLLIPIEKFK